MPGGANTPVGRLRSSLAAPPVKGRGPSLETQIMALYRCHFLDADDHIKAFEEIDAGSLFDAIDRATRCSMRDRTMTRWRSGRVTDGSTVPGGETNLLTGK
jgi:hypothetical protein